jgi:hypothetical protein
MGHIVRPMTTTETTTGERADILAMLAKHRFFLRFTVNGLTDEQAALTPTASRLCLGGLIKHVDSVEHTWADFILEGPRPPLEDLQAAMAEHADGFRMLPGETLDGLLSAYATTAERTDEIARTYPDLDASHPLPEAPWFTPGERWSARRVFMHIIAETAQHAGHADILRETIDGQKSMG